MRVERRDDRRRREQEGEYPPRSYGALKGLPCRVLRHLGLPFARAFALVTPVKQDNPDDIPLLKIRQ